MTKEELLKQISIWLNNHTNPYDKDINEKVYWTMIDLQDMLNSTDSTKVTNTCVLIFNRFKHYHYRS